jgi:hypothetical protein
VSTDYKLYEDDRYELYLWEGSSRFSLMAIERSSQSEIDSDDDRSCIDIPSKSKGRLEAEEVVEIAVKMIQPTLYNVEDPEKFFREVVLKKINELFR